MVVEKQQSDKMPIVILDGERIEVVKEFCYLASFIDKHNRCFTEVKSRIALAKQAFQNKKNLLVNNHISVETRKNPPNFCEEYIIIRL